MPYKINRRPSWIGSALNRVFGAQGGGGDTSNPEVIPDVILPGLDIFGWQAYQNMRTGTNTAAVGIENVTPPVNADWVDDGAGGGEVPSGNPLIALRLMLAMHIQHGAVAGNLIMWFGILDREGGSTGIPTETGTASTIPNNSPLNIIRPFFLRPTESFVGRVRGLNAASFLSLFFTWIDFPEGEYVKSIP